jgi:hypothetical protein
MPFFERGSATIYYEEYGEGYPVLVLAPGSLQSTIDAWHRAPWDPTVELASSYHVIAMDQRNAGRSHAPISESDGWDTYVADQFALLDLLGVQQTHVMGACIGVSFALRMIELQPNRVSAAVLQQPIGINQPRTDMTSFNTWRGSLPEHPEATDATFQTFFQNLYGPMFVYSVSRDFVRSCDKPLLVLPGNDQSHPYEIAQEVAELAPNAEFIADWKQGAAKDAAFARVRTFLAQHTPVGAR